MDSSNTKIQQLQSELGKSRSSISKLTVSSNKRVRTLSRRAKNHKSTAIRQQNQMKQELSTSDKVLKAAQTAEQISTYTVMAGQTTQGIGNIMIATGTAMLSNPFTATAGAALVNAGGVTVNVGTTVQTVGEIGVAASAVTQSATYVAQGNIKGAITSGLRAATVAASAVGGSQALQKGLQGASNLANSAMKNAESVKTVDANSAKKPQKVQTGKAQRRGNA